MSCIKDFLLKNHLTRKEKTFENLRATLMSGDSKMSNHDKGIYYVILRLPHVVWIQIQLSHNPTGLGWSHNMCQFFYGIKEGGDLFKIF